MWIKYWCRSYCKRGSPLSCPATKFTLCSSAGQSHSPFGPRQQPCCMWMNVKREYFYNPISLLFLTLTMARKKEEKDKIFPLSTFLYLEFQYLLTKFNQSSRESCHSSHVHMLFDKSWCLARQTWKPSQPDISSAEKETGSWTIKSWFKQQYYTISNIITPSKHHHYKLNYILEASTLAPLVFYLFQITVLIYLSRALYDHSPSCSDSYGDDLCCHSNIMFSVIVLCLKNIRTQGARQGVIILTACSYKSIFSLVGKKKMKKELNKITEELQSHCKRNTLSVFNQ